LLEQALGLQGSLNQEKIREAMHKIELADTIVGGSSTTKPVEIFGGRTGVLQIQKGQAEIVAPEKAATAKFLYPAIPWEEEIGPRRPAQVGWPAICSYDFFIFTAVLSKSSWETGYMLILQVLINGILIGVCTDVLRWDSLWSGGVSNIINLSPWNLHHVRGLHHLLAIYSFPYRSFPFDSYLSSYSLLGWVFSSKILA